MSLHRRRRARAPNNRGFTLLELGIVIGVSAILAAAIVPDLVETMRNRMAEKAAADVAVAHDAARLFYIQNQNGTVLRWPGEQGAGLCLWALSGAAGPSQAWAQLLSGGYLASGSPNPFIPGPKFMLNPWNQPYEPTLYAPGGIVVSPACLFGIATNVPAAIAPGFISFLPQAACNPPGGIGACPLTVVGGAIPANFVRCCSYVPKPGATATGPCPPATPTMRCNPNCSCVFP